MFGLTKSQQRVNLIVKDHVLRYVYSDQSTLDSIQYCGERFLPKGMIDNGKVIDQSGFRQIVDRLVDKHGWKRKKLNFCVPDASIVMRTQLVPLDIEVDEIKGYLYMQLGESIHLPFEQPIFDYELLGKKEGQREILLFAYPEQRINLLENTFSEAGLKPVVADISALSNYRLYYGLDQAHQRDHLLSLQWNVDAIIVTIFHECKPVFMRHMRTALEPEFWKVEESSKGQALTWKGDQSDLNGYVLDQLTEIERLMNFYRFSVTNGEASITKVLLSGDWPQFNSLKAQCEERFDVKIETIDLQGITTKKGEAIPASYTDALGLTLKGTAS